MRPLTGRPVEYVTCVTTKNITKSYSGFHCGGFCWIGDRILIVAVITTTAESTAFGAASSFAQSLSGWALVIIAGSVVTLVGTSYHRPTMYWRLAYVLFPFGWLFLVLSMYFGVEVQRAYLAGLFSTPTNGSIAKLTEAISADCLLQIWMMQLAIFCFSLWLFVYWLWWLLAKDLKPSGGSDAPTND